MKDIGPFVLLKAYAFLLTDLK
uniref:Uncharacterized protein n=1 Tax=Anguilla anguilla TaxID=7936 RepID=A0A0E9S7A6_ANGAN